MDIKGEVSNVVMALILLFAVTLTAGIAAGFQQLSVKPAPEEVTYEGEFDTFQPLQEVAGSDLSITEQDLNESGVVDDSNVVLAGDLNGSDLETHYLAWGVEIDGSNGMENIDVEASIADASTAEEQDIEKAYVLPDEEDVSLSADNAIATLNVDDGEVDASTGVLGEGEYVFVLETSGTNTGAIASDQDMFDVDFDANTEGDNDVFDMTIDNA